MKNAGIILSLIGTIIIGSCASNKEDQLPKKAGSGCDTTNLTYTNTVGPMLTNYGCVGCHNTQGASGGVVLETYDDVKAEVGRIVPSIEQDPNLSSSKYMPPGAKVSDCDISKVKAWINSGMTK